MFSGMFSERIIQPVDLATGSAEKLVGFVYQAEQTASGSSFLLLFTIFILACFVGYYVVWNVTPALHSPLMSVTNAISSVIIVGALLAAGSVTEASISLVGFFAVMLAAINIFGGFIVTQRMLGMYKTKRKEKKKP